MKTLFKLLGMAFFLFFFGWIYLVYLYLHEENRETLDNLKEDIEDKTKNITKEVENQVKGVSKDLTKQSKEIVKTLSNRIDAMVDFIKTIKKEAFEIKDITERFKDVSERTLRRDLIKLVKMGLIVKEGSTRDTKYKVLKV